jgi:hypothetical protein
MSTPFDAQRKLLLLDVLSCLPTELVFMIISIAGSFQDHVESHIADWLPVMKHIPEMLKLFSQPTTCIEPSLSTPRQHGWTTAAKAIVVTYHEWTGKHMSLVVLGKRPQDVALQWLRGHMQPNDNVQCIKACESTKLYDFVIVDDALYIHSTELQSLVNRYQTLLLNPPCEFTRQ